jgi:3',5'-cyclic AMP phosphodiesterase CpdA
MSRLIQISDTHFGTERPQVVEALVHLVRQTAPEIAVLSGDITQRARRAQFAAARAFMERLGVKHWLVVPGNHDIPLFNVLARALSPYGNYREVFGRDLEPVYETSAFLIVCVNTTRPTRHKDGEVSPEQIERTARRLALADPGQLRIVVVHQPVHVVRRHDVSNLLHGREEGVMRWVEAGADIIMGGHIHLPYVRPLAERYPHLPRRAWVVQAGTAVSHRVREGISNSVNVIRHEPGVLASRIERWDFDEQESAFVRVESVDLALDRNPS